MRIRTLQNLQVYLHRPLIKHHLITEYKIFAKQLEKPGSHHPQTHLWPLLSGHPEKSTSIPWSSHPRHSRTPTPRMEGCAAKCWSAVFIGSKCVARNWSGGGHSTDMKLSPACGWDLTWGSHGSHWDKLEMPKRLVDSGQMLTAFELCSGCLGEF